MTEKGAGAQDGAGVEGHGHEAEGVHGGIVAWGRGSGGRRPAGLGVRSRCFPLALSAPACDNRVKVRRLLLLALPIVVMLLDG
jgi:hypothetical protein